MFAVSQARVPSVRYAKFVNNSVARTEAKNRSDHIKISLHLYCGYDNDKPLIWEWFIPIIYGDLGDGLLYLYPH